MNYNMLSFGINCIDDPELDFCYEAVREDFFDDISEDYFSEAAIPENIKTPLIAIKDWIKKNRKKLVILAGAIAVLTAVALKLKSNAAKEKREEVAEIERHKKWVKGQYDKLKASLDKMEKEYKDLEEESKNINYHIDANNKYRKAMNDDLTSKKKFYADQMALIRRTAPKDSDRDEKLINTYAKHYSDAQKKQRSENIRVGKENQVLRDDLVLKKKAMSDLKKKIAGLNSRTKSWEKYYDSTVKKYNDIASKYNINKKIK